MKISIIIPVYNKEPFLKRCFESIEDQYKKPFEVIVIDDGSTDNSGEICEEYAKKNGWKIYHQTNKGVSSARNLGIEKSSGDFITFLDADDLLMPDSITNMNAASERGYNIVQFKQFRCRKLDELRTAAYGAPAGFYDYSYIPQYWVLVWNKIYKRDFLIQNKIIFREGMQFGEDAIFNAECILANGSIFQVNQVTVIHTLDDMKSLCRGNINLDRIKKLDDELCKLMNKEKDPTKKRWLNRAVEEHRNSKLFKKYGFSNGNKSGNDIVYFVKDSPVNEELRYSLRSVEEHWPYNRVWFCGGCPDCVRPDKYMRVAQHGVDKWNKVRNMIRQVCENDEITENFWLFNDDFFILKPFDKDIPQYNGEIEPYIDRIERKHGGVSDAYTNRLREAAKTLKHRGYTTLNYEVHKPMLINRKKALEVLDKFPNTPAFRSLYGNYLKIGGINRHDMKVKILDYQKMDLVKTEWDFLSSDDESFANGVVGEFIKDRFNKPSRFEKGV